MAKKLRKLDKAIKRSGLDRDNALEVIATEWEFRNMLKPEETKAITLNFDMNKTEDKAALKSIKKIAKELKVSTDAVIGCAIIQYLQKEGYMHGK